MIKGQTTYPFTMLEAAFTFALIMMVAFGAQEYTENYLKQETLDIRADRVSNAATLLANYEAGSIEMDLQDFEVKTEGSDFMIRFDDVEEERSLAEPEYGDIDGPSEFEEFSSICLDKTLENELEISEGC